MQGHRRFLLVALLAGITYVVIGRVFAWPSTHIILWRWAAWAASAIVFGAHIWHEHVRLGHGARRTAGHAALGVAIGGCGLAIAAIVYAITNGTFTPRWYVMPIVWAAVVGIPAWVAAWTAASAITWIRARVRAH